MDPSASSPIALWALLAAFAVLVTGAIYLFLRTRKTPPEHVPASASETMMPVMDAAAAAHEVAKRERMAIAVVAEAQHDAIAWLAQSIARVVPVYRIAPSGDFDKDDGVGTSPQSLYITRRSYRTYLGW